MGVDEIAHLDFAPVESLTLRERAAIAYDVAAQEQKLELVRIAAEQAAAVLDHPCGKVRDVQVTNVRDGDGHVLFDIEGIQFRVSVAYPVNHGGDRTEKPSMVNLTVKCIGASSWLAIPSLAELGRLIHEGKVIDMPDGDRA